MTVGIVVVSAGVFPVAVRQSSVNFTDEKIVAERPPSPLDELILDVAEILETNDVQYVVVSGYVAVLFGRSRSTEDIDVLTEQFDREIADSVTTDLQETGYWGPAMPLDDLYETVSDGLPIRIAESGNRIPNVELKFVSDEYDRLSLSDTIEVDFDGRSLQIVTPELQVAYKLGMSAERDFEDATHLYQTVQRSLNTTKLESYVEQLGVEDGYERLREQ